MKINPAQQKTPCAVQEPAERIHNFCEVSLGFNVEQAQEEARRCLNCATEPCRKGCPVQVPIPAFIAQVREGKFEEAYQTVLSENYLPEICGRVCPQEKQCEQFCVRAKKGESVAIGRLERFVGDYHRSHTERGTSEDKAPQGKQAVAIVGSGPAGLTCAAECARLGYSVTLYEALHRLGGVLIYGIPPFRLPKDIVAEKIEDLQALGVRIEKNVIIGRSLTMEDLFEDGFKAVFIGSGAGLPRFMGIEGENLNGVYSANEFLTRVNLMGAHRFPETDTPLAIGERVIVVGGGNVAMDAARTAIRLGVPDVSIVYRRSMQELPAREEEVHHAQEEGVQFKLLQNPLRILGEQGAVKGVECIAMQLGEADASGRRRPVPIEGSESILAADTVIMAIGQTPNPLLKQTTPNLDINRRGGIIVNSDTMETSIPGVYAGGDAVTGVATVIEAMGAGKRAAYAIHDYLKNIKE